MPSNAAPRTNTQQAAGVGARPAPGAPVSPAQPGVDAALAKRTDLVLRELGALPTLPSIAMRLLQLGANEEVDIKEVVRVIETDPALTTRLLALCKRAATRTRVPITTVEMAVVMLGLEAVRSLVLSVQIFDWTNRLPRRAEAPKVEPGGFDRVGFWQHSVAVACAAELVVREHGGFPFHAQEAFVCGLLHDIGKLALELVLPKAYARVIELADRRGCSLTESERAIVGLDHCQAGANLAQAWGLPILIHDAMGMHHATRHEIEVLAGEHQKIVAVVAIADTYARTVGLGWSGNRGPIEDVEVICARVGLDAGRLNGIPDKLYEATSSRLRDLGLGDEPSQQVLVDSILRANDRLSTLNHELMETNTRLKATQDELAEAQSLARLGQITAGAAHEMNNPLAVISGRAQTLVESVRDERDRAGARSIIEATRRLSELIARLNRIAAPPAPNRRPVGIADLLAAAVARARQRFAERPDAGDKPAPVMGVKVFVPEGLPACGFDRDLMTDALVEVIVNALEAKPRSGVDIRVQIGPENDRLLISVADDGAGMSREALVHALDPFYSHKPAGRQAGLGLALAHRMVRLHDGDLELASTPGEGTTVTLWFEKWRAERETYAAEVRAQAA